MRSNQWYPYTQMKTTSKFPKVYSGKGVHLHLENNLTLMDATASWWCNIHGYSHPRLNRAMIEQINKVSHVMAGGFVTEASSSLSEKLISISPKGLNHVFYSDGGSTGMEVAAKMSVQYWFNKGEVSKKRFISVENAYHGDTFKMMELGNGTGFHSAFDYVVNRGFIAPLPVGGWNTNEAAIQEALIALEKILINHHAEIAAFFIEPIFQGAAGFRLHSPLYLEKAVQLCKKYNVLVVFDEVATGFGRTGKLFASNHIQSTPDIMVLSKGLTAGYIGHSATLTTSEIYDGFYDDDPKKALMHGQTFMANPIACAVALESIAIFEDENYINKIEQIFHQIQLRLSKWKHQHIKEIRCIGPTACIEVNEISQLKGFQQFAKDRGAWFRPFGKIVYLTPPYIISKEELAHLIDILEEWFFGER